MKSANQHRRMASEASTTASRHQMSGQRTASRALETKSAPMPPADASRE